jgi:prevent-host-death family protein
MSSKITTLTEAKLHFSSWIRLAESGQEVVITRRGTPIAKLVPLTPQPRRDALARKAAITSLLSFEAILIPTTSSAFLVAIGRE